MKLEGGQRRVIIEGVTPEIDGGRFPCKRIVGDKLVVEADIFADGHDVISAVLRYTEPSGEWREIAMVPLRNDRWRGEFPLLALGRARYTIAAWIDHYQGWRRDLRKRIDVGEDIAVQRQIGAAMIARAAERATSGESALVEELRAFVLSTNTSRELLTRLAETAPLLDRLADRSLRTDYGRELEVVIERERAQFSSWYELFPRSAAGEARHGTLQDVIARLPYVQEMGFDVLYLPPIHPIGEQFRKGKNNATAADTGDVGSPWAVGGAAGGHDSIHPELGTDADFDQLVAAAKARGMEIALDIAFQAAPDHPLVETHPEFFLWRPDNTVQYAENPPKKYQDIYPFHFETDAWRELWAELRRVFEHWIDRGVRIFRVDNPHTKPLPFWEWCVNSLRDEYPDVIFLAEAFTRPRVMYYLAKAGYTQGYTYFTWRTTKQELTDYMMELTTTEVKDYFRPNFWPNTPDILPEQLQSGLPQVFQARLVLAATLSSNYGIYGPAYELLEHVPRSPGAEEYFNSEKYEVRHWNLDDPKSQRHFIARVNRVRNTNDALRRNDTLRFHTIENDQMLAYSKSSADGENIVLIVVNLDPHSTQSGWLTLDLQALGIDPMQPFQLHEQLTGARFTWTSSRNEIELNPGIVPAFIFAIRRRVRTESDFDYYF